MSEAGLLETKSRNLTAATATATATADATMFYLQNQLFSLRRLTSPVLFSLRCDLSSTAAATDAASLGHSAAEDYLVTSCGLTRERAVKCAKHISHCKSTSNADAVLAFLAGSSLCLAKADIANLVAKDPLILNCSVDKTLKVRLDAFRSHGLSDAQLRKLLCVAPSVIRSFNKQERLGFWIPFLGSPENFLRIVRHNYYLTSDLERVIKPNIELLRECGLSPCAIAKMCVTNSRLLTSKQETVKAVLARADELGVPRSSPMFRQAVTTMTCFSPETISAKLKLFGETFGWSEAEVASAVRRNPVVLRYSAEKLHSVSEFLTKVVGIDAKYILQRPNILMYSLEGRLVPRHYVLKLLQENGLIHKDHGYYSMISHSEESFRRRYINTHKVVLPDLDHAYTVACKGKLPTGVTQ